MYLVLVTVVAALAAMPLWLAGTRACRSVAVGLVALAIVGMFVGDRRTPPVGPPTDRPIEHADGAYIGSDTCRSCHPAEHASWHGSFHRTMTQVATPQTLVPQFERLELDWFGKPVVLEWRAQRLWAKFVRGGRRPAAVERPIEQLTGSHNLQVLWYSTGEMRELAPVPMCFKIAEQRWIPLTSVFVLPPEFRDPPEPGAWNRSCNECHTTHARPGAVDGGWDTAVTELGIACEACHGPGREHAERNRNPIRRYAARLAGHDDAITNPATLPPARSAEVCGHCHSVRILRERHFDSWRRDGSPFEPGDDLQASHLVVSVEDREAPELRRELQSNPNFFASSFWPDGMVRLSGREFSGMRRAPCYVHGDRQRQLDCTSCHRMHTDDGGSSDDWRAGQMRADRRDNRACTQCHEALARPAALQKHTHHAPESVGSSCYDCHMSHTSIGLMKASRSHQIDSPDVAVELATGRPNACNQCHLDRSLGWTAERLQRDWGVAPPSLTTEQQQVAAGVAWLLSGDAGQRMLAAWSFGYEPAQQASATDWMAPYLARLLDDPYYVVRFNAERSLRALGGYGGALVGYDFLTEKTAAAPFVDTVTALWQSGYRGGARPRVLMAARGLDRAPFQQLYARRDDRPVYIAE